MSDIKQAPLEHDLPRAAKLPWQTPDLEVLTVGQTQNNGLIPPGDGTYSPSPSGS
ncbi:hypothetical protein GCM10011505_50330 [Tistrella bauzanensis]|uniref:Paeninodin family lasso peptide n=1 Tax=Tistrella bauzanensis TaxID=657419 RepID=A0ABQ1JDF8_9PROT|nr:hypothetical protein [Tistrella bauzanensis]GGB63704.1 hypothetical protein GCM10011505_50330 [Tistrella bauzanensis]